MEINNIKSFLEDINISLFVFPEEKDGMVEFKPIDCFISDDNFISFSVLLSIEYNKPKNKNFELNLLKLNHDNSDSLNTFLLETFSFDENNALTGTNGEYICDQAIRIPSIDFKDFTFRHTLRYSFNKVPLCGEGFYFLSVGITCDDSFLPIKSVPIKVELTKEYNKQKI